MGLFKFAFRRICPGGVAPCCIVDAHRAFPPHPMASALLRPYRPQLLRSAAFALIASPFFIAAAPSQAALVPKTFTSFTEAFGLANNGWTLNVNGTTATVTTANTDADLNLYHAGGLNSSNSPRAVYTVDSGVFNTYAPTSVRPLKFVKGTLNNFDWSWTSTSTTSATSSYRFKYQTNRADGGLTDVTLAPPASPGSVRTYSGTVNPNPDLEFFAGDTFTFLNSKNSNSGGGGATGTINNFSFTAYYTEVPGPLPLAGAAGAFAWSRRIRRRLKSAQSAI